MLNLFIDNIVNNTPRVFKFLRGKNLFFLLDHSCRRLNLGNRFASFTVSTEAISPKNIIYSFGIGNDISFDLEMIRRFDVVIFAFDPTPKSIQWLEKQDVPNQFKAFPCGLANYNGEAEFFLPENENYVSASMVSKLSGTATKVKVKRLIDIMEEHNHTSIDILKMDIEGAEYDVIEDILGSGIKIHQLLIEFHHRFFDHGTRKTRHAIEMLKNAGFCLFYVSPNGEEFSFINLDYYR